MERYRLVPGQRQRHGKHTIENIERIFKAAKTTGFEVFISPHYYYTTDHLWQFGGTVEKRMHGTRMR